MSVLVLYLFGPPRMERDGEPLSTDTRKAIALLAYLAMTRQRHSRDALANLLWPDYDQPHARATLRRTLSALNKALAGQWLNIGRETVGLDEQASFWFDVEAFREKVAVCRTHEHAASEVCQDCRTPLAEAAKLYRDDFMAGFSLNDSSNFDDWQFYQGDGLRRELASVLERLVYCASAQGDFEAGIRYARRWLQLDRLHEPAHRQLMLLYAWSGQRTTSLQHYRECIETLNEELGVAPLEATTDLYTSIKANHIPKPPTFSRSASPAPAEQRTVQEGATPTPAATAYPLVGRANELATLLQAYAQGSGQIAIIEGEAGIGKTRLAEEFLEHLRREGTMIVTTRSYEGEVNLAYGPVVAGLRSALAQRNGRGWLERVPAHWLSEAARLLPELTTLFSNLSPTLPLDSPGAQGRFLEGLRQVLLAMYQGGSDGRIGVIFFDDVQWADGATLEFLSYVIRRLREHPLFLLLSYRSAQPSSEQRLQHLLMETQRSGQITHLALARIDQEAIRDLLQTMPQQQRPTQAASLAERLYAETEGLPLFLTEYLTAMTAGTSSSEEEEWSLPGGVRELLHSRLAAVTDTSRQILSTAATIGRSFDFDTLREASGRSEEETVTALEELVHLHLVREVEETTGSGTTGYLDEANEQALFYDFSHEKLRHLAYEETSQARRRLLHRRIADILVHARGKRDGRSLTLQIAHHYQMAGNRTMAAEYYIQAGDYARRLYAHAEALTHFRAALALGHSDKPRLYEALGDLHTFLGEYPAALTHYTLAAGLLSGAKLARIEHKIGKVYDRRGAWEEAEQHFETALHLLQASSATSEQARIYADWSLTAYHHKEVERASLLAEQALELAKQAHDAPALAQAHNMLGILAHNVQNLAEARSHLEASLELTKNLHDPDIRIAALNNLALVHKEAGDIEEALSLTREALALSISQGDRHREAALHNNLADLLYFAGRAEESMAHLKSSVAIYVEIGVEAGAVQPEIWKLSEW